jgi:AcrR family transcriptional regulator
MPYRRTENVERRLAARHDAIIAAARNIASEGGMAAVQIVPVAQRAGIAAGTVYRYFPAKIDLVAALLGEISDTEIDALRRTADGAPGPLSALAASIMTFAVRALRDRRLASRSMPNSMRCGCHFASRSRRNLPSASPRR